MGNVLFQIFGNKKIYKNFKNKIFINTDIFIAFLIYLYMCSNTDHSCITNNVDQKTVFVFRYLAINQASNRMSNKKMT